MTTTTTTTNINTVIIIAITETRRHKALTNMRVVMKLTDRIKFPTKRISQIFYTSKINIMMPFGNLFMG